MNSCHASNFRCDISIDDNWTTNEGKLTRKWCSQSLVDRWAWFEPTLTNRRRINLLSLSTTTQVL